MNEYYEKLMKAIIRENIADGMIKASGVHPKENPYAAAEFIEAQQETLNRLTEKAYNEINDRILEKIK